MPLCKYAPVMLIYPTLNITIVADDSSSLMTSNCALTESFHTVVFSLSLFALGQILDVICFRLFSSFLTS